MKDIIDNIEVKLNRLIKTYQELSEKTIILTQENGTLLGRLKLKDKELLNLKEKIKLMNISKSVDSSKEEVKATRFKINEYVREIDKCIALLNK